MSYSVLVKDACRIGIYGRSGSGKTAFVKQHLRSDRRALIFDPLAEYPALCGIRAADTLRGVLDGVRAGWRRGFKIAYMPPAGREAEALHDLCKLILRVQEPYREGVPIPKLTLVVEELNLSFPVAALPRDLTGFAELCSRGRHWGVNLIGVSQRVAEVNTRFRGNTDRALFFAQQDHRDVSTIVSMIGPSWRAALQALQPGEYLELRGGHVGRGKIALPR